MTVEQLVVDGLRLALDPVPVWFMTAPQSEDDDAPPLPLVIVSNAGMSDLAPTTCGNGSVFTVTLQVDAYAYSAEEARMVADEVRVVMPTLVAATLEFSQFVYEPDPRAWRVTSDWSVTEAAPILATGQPQP
jgi:hypothetical protein